MVLSRKAQETGSQAAIVIAILTLMLIFYILFLPPEERAALLGERDPSDPTRPTYPGTVPKSGDILFTTTPGFLKYTSFSSYEYDIPSVTIYQTTDSTVLTKANDIFVRRGWFENREREITFTINDKDSIERAQLSLTLRDYSGIFSIELNGKEIYNYESQSSNIGPITLDKANLQSGQNVLRFSLSNVGLKFWTVNEYHIDNLAITAAVSDYSQSQSRSSFHIPSDHSKDIEKATIRFMPDCRSHDTGTLIVSLNGRTIFEGSPDCGILNTHKVSPSSLYIGTNTLSFSTPKGNYLIDQISVLTEIAEPDYPTYYFDLDSNLFHRLEKRPASCGEVDGICPVDCGSNLDKDCCFEEYPNGYWCPGKTDLIGDRCVERVVTQTCDRCPQGYEDKRGNPPAACEGLCGDNTDGACPLGCSPNYDKDCCFAQEGEWYWCYDLPITGIDYTCVDSLTIDSCRYCPTGYVGKYENPKCDYDDHVVIEERLKSGTHIELELKFTQPSNRKEAIIFINGFQTGFQTRDASYTRRIDSFVESGTNSLRIIPKTDLDIRELNIKIE